MRNSKHYRQLLDRNPAASVGFALAAAAVYASIYGECEAEHHSTEEWKQIARDLKARYGETLTADAVLAEMKRGVGAPTSPGYAALLTVRARDKAEWDALRDEMTATERGEACREWLAKNQRCF